MKSLLAAIVISLAVPNGSGAHPELPAGFQRIAAIQVPIVDVESCTIDELVDFLRIRIAELDPKKPGGVSLILAGFPPIDTVERGPDGEVIAIHRDSGGKSYNAKNKRVDQLFREAAAIWAVEFHVTDVGVVVTPAGKKPFPNIRAKEGELYFTYKGEARQAAARKPSAAVPE